MSDEYLNLSQVKERTKSWKPCSNLDAYDLRVFITKEWTSEFFTFLDNLIKDSPNIDPLWVYEDVTKPEDTQTSVIIGMGEDHLFLLDPLANNDQVRFKMPIPQYSWDENENKRILEKIDPN